MTNKIISAFALCAGMLFSISANAQQISGRALQSDDKSIKESLEQIRKDARNDFQLTAKALRGLDPTRMNAEDRATWVRLSRETAVRTGDLATLSSLKELSDPFSLLPLSRILLANAFLNEANLTAAHAELGKLSDLSKINTRDQRRYWALKARLGQLENRVGDERAAIEHIVHEIAHWPSSDCQSCHNDLKNPQVLQVLEIKNTWFGKRFVELMQKQGDADTVRHRAENRLATKPDEMDARIFLGFALLAQGNQEAAEQCWAEIPWVALPNRKGESIRMMFAWP